MSIRNDINGIRLRRKREFRIHSFKNSLPTIFSSVYLYDLNIHMYKHVQHASKECLRADSAIYM